MDKAKQNQSESRNPEPPEALRDLGPQNAGYLANLKHDLPASVVVFLVALPLCLGIAVASGAPPLAGLITGIVGGVVVAWASGSHLAVSGPAAGLTTIVLVAIDTLGYQGFLLAVVLAGALQFGFGILRAGIFAYYFPSSVIKGMLAAIGIILIMKQLPHAVGLDSASFEGDLTLLRDGQMGPLEALTFSFTHMHVGATIIAGIGLVMLIAWAQIPALKKLKWLPGPLVAVGLGIGINVAYQAFAGDLFLSGEHLVSLPTGGLSGLFAEMSFPDFGRIGDVDVWSSAFTIAAVASIETLLCIEAIDKLDPYKRNTPTNRELAAQGIGNMIAGSIGGLPMTAVIVRGSANIHSGARSRVSAFAHGLLLLIGLVLLPMVLNMIPLAALAAVLLHVGYKLANPTLVIGMFRQSMEQWAPFAITVAAILATDLLKGVGIGMAVAVFFILRANLKTPYFIHHRESHEETGKNCIRIELSENVSFLNKASVNKVLHELPGHSMVEIDARPSMYIHPDVLELIHEFEETAHTRDISVTLVDVPAAPGKIVGH